MQEGSYKPTVQFDGRSAPSLNARAWVSVEVSRDIDLDLGAVSFMTGFPGIDCHAGRVVAATSLDAVPASCYQIFEPVRLGGARALRWREAHSRIHLYTWGDANFTLAAGTCRATLVDDDRLLQLRVGDILIFEQVLGETSGEPLDADPQRRHAVRLTLVEAIADLADEARELVAIEWHADDRLPFALPVSRCAAGPGAGRIQDISMALGNTLLVDHGCTIKESFRLGDDDNADDVHGPDRDTYVLARSPLAFAEPYLAHMSASAAFNRNISAGRAQVSCIAIAADDDDTSPAITLWQPRANFDDSGPTDCHFVVSVRSDGAAQLRFGDGVRGRRPGRSAVFIATYRISQSAALNVSRDRIAYMVSHTPVMQGPLSGDVVIKPRNPLPVAGGAAAPGTSWGSRLQCQVVVGGGYAVRPEEYAALAQRHALVRQAAAWFSPQSGGHLVHVAIDRYDSAISGWLVRQEIEAMLTPYLAPRHALCVVSAERVPLELVLQVRLQQGADRAAVRRTLLELFSAGMSACGRPGFFHPARLKLGQPVHSAALRRLTAGVAGVDSIAIAYLGKVGDPASARHGGVLAMEANQLPCLRNDPGQPQAGTLLIDFVD